MQKLIETGEKENLKEMLRTKLVECGWRDDLREHCKEVIRSKGLERITVDELVQIITPRGRGIKILVLKMIYYIYMKLSSCHFSSHPIQTLFPTKSKQISFNAFANFFRAHKKLNTMCIIQQHGEITVLINIQHIPKNKVHRLNKHFTISQQEQLAITGRRSEVKGDCFSLFLISHVISLNLNVSLLPKQEFLVTSKFQASK
mmetsp:Transcript_35139/g.45319  ORF Transcript_35139/g.45319 Transcript_35139/m.45319 type:complete len:202 (-) Transcript_35139:30-635(-)